MASHAAIDATKGQTRASILLVDDDDKLLANLGTFLTDNGFRPVCVPNVQQALDAAACDQMDVVVLDYRLDGQSGLYLIQELRRQRSTVPIVLMSGYLDDWVESLARSFGPLCCLGKPFSDRQMLGAIDESRRLFGWSHP